MLFFACLHQVELRSNDQSKMTVNKYKAHWERERKNAFHLLGITNICRYKHFQRIASQKDCVLHIYRMSAEQLAFTRKRVQLIFALEVMKHERLGEFIHKQSHTNIILGKKSTKKWKLNRRMNGKAWWKTQRNDAKVEVIFLVRGKKSENVRIWNSIKTISQ